MTNPTVPNADQKSAINASAPDAKSVNVPDASDNKAPAQTPAQTKEADQGTTPAVNLDKTSGKAHANQVASDARKFEENVGEDSFRKAARLERKAQEEANRGDPTRDPVAKQAAMDMNTGNAPQKASAERIKAVGEKEQDKQAKRDGNA